VDTHLKTVEIQEAAKTLMNMFLFPKLVCDRWTPIPI